MSSEGEIHEPHLDLKDVIASGQLSEPLLKRAEDILSRIERPVRLGVMGLPGSGKSALLNLLLGAETLPSGFRLPTINLTYGPEPLAICTLSDGTKETIKGSDLSAVAEVQPVFVDASLPLPALKKLSMMEVVAGSNPVEQQRATQWASKRIDIALWCSARSFGPEEQGIWDHMPEKIQDHSFLVLTKTDASNAPVGIDQRLADAKYGGQDFFKQVLPIGTATAIAARKRDGSVDKKALKDSGGAALISAILRDVEAGRQVAIDQAHVFLRQIDFESVKATTVEPVKTAEPIAQPPTPKTNPIEETDPETVAEVITLSPALRPAIKQAVAQLAEEGKIMSEALAGGALDDTIVVETCVDTVTWLADFLSDGGASNDAVYTKICDAAVDAADLVQLIKLEPGDTVASDALCVMIQLKQDMQMSLAA